jgi:hypothetical protein
MSFVVCVTELRQRGRGDSKAASISGDSAGGLPLAREAERDRKKLHF